MDIKGTQRFLYWCIYLVFIIILLIGRTAEKVDLLFRVILILLLAFLSARFRLADLYSFLSIGVVVLAGFMIGAVLAEDAFQFWSFTFVFVVLFFLSCKVYDKKLLGT
jgi:hypothetical protein